MRSQPRGRRHLYTALVALIVVLGALAIRPVPLVALADCLEATGRVSDVFEGGTHDVVFTLDGDQRRFYVNRGLERGLDLAQLRDTVIGERATLKYPDYWTPLDPTGSTRHLSRVELGDVVLFDETRSSTGGEVIGTTPP